MIVTLFDGFSPAMVDATKTPNLDAMKKDGVWSRHLVPAFPSVSLINHTTYETGCWPEHHGIMSNTFYDPKWGRFGGPDTKPPVADADWHTGCEAMWEAAERQGVHAAVYNWVGRWSGTRGPLATYTNPLEKRRSRTIHRTMRDLSHRRCKLLADNGPNHPRLIALYFHRA